MISSRVRGSGKEPRRAGKPARPVEVLDRRGEGQAEASAATAQQQAQSWWDETRSSIDNQFATLRAKRDEHRAERGLHRAERRADDAELDAADAVDFAMAVLVQAEYAIIDATLARADADDLAKQQRQ